MKKLEKTTDSKQKPNEIFNTQYFLENKDPVPVGYMGILESEECEELTEPPLKDEITGEMKVWLDIPTFMLSPYVLFSINNKQLCGLVDGGSPYSFMNLDLWEKLTSRGYGFRTKGYTF